jgi:steroid 5-alpha reductase family enzyme
VGVLVWLVGFYFEAVGDWQLKKFIKNPENKGKIMQSGLWAYSRHPNYFGEVTMWWGIWLLNFSQNWWTVVGPMTITFLILKVSGVPLLEKKYEGNKEFEDYKKRTSIFLPLPQRKK